MNCVAGCPFTGQMWSAAHGLGAYSMPGQRLRLVNRRKPGWRVVLDPALELAYLAPGEFDGLVQVGGSPVQDFAAGVLLIREAGGLVTGLDGCADPWLSQVVVAGTATYEHVREMLQDP